MVDMSAAAEMLTRYQADAEGEEKRLLAWRHCYEAFGEVIHGNGFKSLSTKDRLQYLALHLYVYMFCFGMLRKGRAKKGTHKYFDEAVTLVLKYPELHGIRFEELLENPKRQEDWKRLFKEIKEAYSCSELFVLKILMGTLGCFPAVDTCVKKALEDCTPPKEYPNNKFGDFRISYFLIYLKKFKSIYDEIRKNPEVAEFMRKHPEYPEMRIVDMVLWEMGKPPKNGKQP